MDLTEQEHQLLEFEESHPRHTRAKEDLLRSEFGLSPARYYQTMSTLIDTAAALRDYPLLVRRLRRRRDDQRRARQGAAACSAQ